MKRKYVAFAEAPDGRLFVRVDAVMDPLCALIDGLTIAYFGKEKMPYLHIDTAIEWCRKESSFHGKEKYDKMIAMMEKAKLQKGN